MIRLVAENLGHRFGAHWVFRNIDLDLRQGQRIAITGHNGAGKSTLLKLLAGLLPPSEGCLFLEYQGKQLSPDRVFSIMALSAPYQELPEELTMREVIRLWANRQKSELNHDPLIEAAGLGEQKDKPLRYFSSGMKQKVKYLLCVLSQRPIILLDEPTSHLDEASEAWLLQDLISWPSGLLLLASNKAQEIQVCYEKIILADTQ